MQSTLYQSKLMHVQFGKGLLEIFCKKKGGMSEEILDFVLRYCYKIFFIDLNI